MGNVTSCCSNAPAINVETQEMVTALANDKECNFDARELRDFVDSWLQKHPTGKASRDEMLSFFQSSWPAASAPNVEVCKKLVAAIDTNHDGQIAFREAVLGLSAFMRGHHEAKVHMLFWALDADGSGSVSKPELRDALITQMSDAQLVPDDTVKHRLSGTVNDIFAKADLDGDGALNLEELLNLVNSDPKLNMHFMLSDKVFDFNSPEASAKTRLAAIKEIATMRSISCTAPSVVDILTTVPGLSPVAIGQFLGSKDDDGFYSECASLFFEKLEFKGKTLDEAIRSMSSRLCLPPEAQQIDRLIEAFSGSYCRDNPQVFPDTDSVYLTAFAIVMLNADAHTANVKNKMTKDQFVKNLQSVKVDTAVLEQVYDRVTTSEIKLSAVDKLGGSLDVALLNTGNAEITSMLKAMAEK